MDPQSQQSELKRLIIKGKEQGFLTYREINDHLPEDMNDTCLLYTSPSPRDYAASRMPSSA